MQKLYCIQLYLTHKEQEAANTTHKGPNLTLSSVYKEMDTCKGLRKRYCERHAGKREGGTLASERQLV